MTWNDCLLKVITFEFKMHAVFIIEYQNKLKNKLEKYDNFVYIYS